MFANRFPFIETITLILTNSNSFEAIRMIH
ncbi:hypothetical protein NGUA38_00824 [Salmonella enterica]|nr:hypothetical protein NGUA38_00824 [Salmonella enterica]